MILETTFLIDFEREAAHQASGPAHAFLERHADEPFFITFTIAGELACGPIIERDGWEALISPFRILPHNRDVCWHYGETFRFLKRNGLLIGTNDLWIAATGLAYRQTVVSRNREHFARVPGLDVATY